MPGIDAYIDKLEEADRTAQKIADRNRLVAEALKPVQEVVPDIEEDVKRLFQGTGPRQRSGAGARGEIA
ncbi:hypothetical protein [Sinorhizobium americanum]|uniref:Uncharacterized protein n=1 Tax=Sinorhizobium americanum TaxID=194963 RepID=A0A1L3LLU9_9HYPH|nr:hypothetical protein [Sinorhizobium americanum]APG91055.1 hypothetical protein SAMCFNEI73_Ch1763 [Sinorhizobium americanum]OAP43648.1 hypothetical protein ATC00_01995 [Sinorhizobium americanum]